MSNQQNYAMKSASLEQAIALSGLPDTTATRNYFASMKGGELLAFVNAKLAEMAAKLDTSATSDTSATDEAAKAAKAKAKAEKAAKLATLKAKLDSIMASMAKAEKAAKLAEYVTLNKEAMAIRDEIASLQSARQFDGKLTFKVSEKGAVSVYGIGRFPTTLYSQQWERLIAAIPDLQAFMLANKSSLATKTE